MKAYYQGKSIPASVRQELDRRASAEKTVDAIRGKLTLADIADDPLSRRYAVSRIDQSRMGMVNFSTPNQGQKFSNVPGVSIDPTSPQMMLARGSTSAIISDTIAFTSTTTSITWIWTGLVLYRADGSTTNIPNGNLTFSSLTANTTYWFYPYWSEAAQSVNWAGGANTAISLTSAQTMYAQVNVPLSSGGIKVTTPSSGTGGGSGGGGGNGCLHALTPIRIRRDGEIVNLHAKHLVAGDEVQTPEGEWVAILRIEKEACSNWVEIGVDVDQEPSQCATVTPSQPLYREDGSIVKARDLQLGDRLKVGDDLVGTVSIANKDEGWTADKVIIYLPPPHIYVLNPYGFWLHNGNPKF